MVNGTKEKRNVLYEMRETDSRGKSFLPQLWEQNGWGGGRMAEPACRFAECWRGWEQWKA